MEDSDERTNKHALYATATCDPPTIRDSPSGKLWLEVLFRAYADTKSKDPKKSKPAQDWFESTSTHVGSFMWIRDVLEQEYSLERLVRRRERTEKQIARKAGLDHTTYRRRVVKSEGRCDRCGMKVGVHRVPSNVTHCIAYLHPVGDRMLCWECKRESGESNEEV